MRAALQRAWDKINWKVIGRWSAAYFVVLVALSILDAIHYGWGRGLGVVIACYMVATKVEPRNWWGRLDDEWRCPHCTLHVRSNSPVMVAQFRNQHVHPEADA